MAYGNTNKNGTGTPYHLLVDDDGRLRTVEDWTPALQSDVALNDSDKSFTVPANTWWKVKTVWVEYTDNGAGGARQLVVEIQDDTADVIAVVKAGVQQAAGPATYYYLFAPHVAELTAVRDADSVTTLMPEWTLLPSYVVRVYDQNAVAAAADDMVVHVYVEQRTVT